MKIRSWWFVPSYTPSCTPLSNDVVAVTIISTVIIVISSSVFISIVFMIISVILILHSWSMNCDNCITVIECDSKQTASWPYIMGTTTRCVIQSLILHELNWIESRITHLVVILWYTKTSIPFITVPFLVLPLLYHPVLCLCVVPGLYSTRTRLVVVDVGVIPFVVVVVVSFVLLSLLVSSFTTSWLCGSDTNNSELSCRVVSCKLLLFNGITNIN